MTSRVNMISSMYTHTGALRRWTHQVCRRPVRLTLPSRGQIGLQCKLLLIRAVPVVLVVVVGVGVAVGDHPKLKTH